MNEIKAIEAIDNALNALDDDARARVLSWAQQKYSTSTLPIPNAHQSSASSVSTERSTPPSSTHKSKKQPKSSKKAKSIISMDKTLDLTPANKPSATQFATEKSPANNLQKCVVAVYYLRHMVEMEKVTVEAVFTFFKHLSWPIPADLKNTLQKAGAEGWLDTSDSQHIKLTSMGENLVEYNLPNVAKAK